jgi:hypothetical protein
MWYGGDGKSYVALVTNGSAEKYFALQGGGWIIVMILWEIWIKFIKSSKKGIDFYAKMWYNVHIIILGGNNS